MKWLSRGSALWLLVVLFGPGGAGATPTAGPGFQQLASIPTPELVTGGVVAVGDTLFVGQGGFGSTQSILRIDPDGTTTTVATGFASLSGLTYDVVGDRLLVGDNASNVFLPAAPGRTLYEVPDPFTDPPSVPDASTLQLITPVGPDPVALGLTHIADIFPDPSDPSGQTLLVTNAAGPPGSLLRVDLVAGTATPLAATVFFAGGVVADDAADRIYFGDADSAPPFGSGDAALLELALSVPDTADPAAEDLGGQFDLALGEGGRLYSSSGDELLLIDPVTGTFLTVAAGFAFATGIAFEDGLVYALDSGGSEIFVFTPEPGTLLLVLSGLGALCAGRRRPAGDRP